MEGEFPVPHALHSLAYHIHRPIPQAPVASKGKVYMYLKSRGNDLYLFPVLNSSCTFNAGLRDNCSARLFNCSIFFSFHGHLVSCGRKRDYDTAFIYFLLRRILHITGTRCFSLQLYHVLCFGMALNRCQNGKFWEGRVMKETVSIGIKFNFLQRLNINYNLFSITFEISLYSNSMKSYYTTKISTKCHMYI